MTMAAGRCHLHVADHERHTVTMRHFNADEVGAVFGVSPSDLAGWRVIGQSALAAGSPGLTLNQLELLAASQTPYRIARAVALRIERQRQRAIERAAIAGRLLRANLSTPGKRFSMNDAALARVAAAGRAAELALATDAQLVAQTHTSNEGATNGSDTHAVPTVEVDCEIPDKRRLRGEARAASRAEKARRVALPPSTLGKVRGNGRERQAKPKARPRRQGGWWR